MISIANNLYGYATSTFSVADGSAPVDLKVTGALSAGSASHNLSKSGAGTMVLTGSSTHANATFTVSNGTLLVNNVSGSGTGKSAVAVSATGANATLGGIGVIGGVAGYTNANVTVGGSSTYVATLDPGTVNETTGAQEIGTLTVGSATQANNVTVNAYGKLSATVSGATNDRLTVNGNVTIGGANTTLAINVGAAPTLGSYTLLSCTGTLSGTFATVTGVPAGYSVVYSGNSVQLQAAGALTRLGPASSPQATPISRIIYNDLFNSEKDIATALLA